MSNVEGIGQIGSFKVPSWRQELVRRPHIPPHQEYLCHMEWHFHSVFLIYTPLLQAHCTSASVLMKGEQAVKTLLEAAAKMVDLVTVCVMKRMSLLVDLME